MKSIKPNTWIELNQTALLSNIHNVKKITRNTSLGFVVKSNAYGHGIVPVSTVLETIPEVAWLFTIGFQEGCTLRARGITKKILALGYHDLELQEAIIHDIDIPITYPDKALADYINQQAQTNMHKASIHLKIETGLGRLGFAEHEVLAFAQYIKEHCPWINLRGIYTHLSDPNNEDLTYTYHQLAIFNRVLQTLQQHNIHIPYTHVLASGSLFLPFPNKPEYNYSTVRIGGNLYGFWKSELQKKRFQEIDPTIELHPVLSWKTQIVHLGYHPKDSSIGYARSFTAKRDSIIAILPVGYTDGYPRILSNNAHVWVNGVLAPIAGMVSMNLMAIDVTEVPNIAIGTEVTLIGQHQGVTADELAKRAGTINNELVTRLNPGIARQMVLQPINEVYDHDQASIARI